MVEEQEKKPEFVRNAEARQHNILFSDILRNGLSFNYFLWKGSPDVSLAHRLGLIFVSGIPLTYAAAIYDAVGWGTEDRGGPVGLLVATFIASPFFYVTGKLLRNAFRRK
ncbi:MAG: hypothetical protein EXQ56_06250 [Acidobacteria bacterium]|nr:hypothetical protein [Acidobacteriota bacterium]